MTDRTANRPSTPHVRVAVVGAGFSGIGAGVRLLGAGIDDFLVLERAAEIGGTWRDNTYPGCACDVPSNLYSFSFAPNPSWPHSFSAQPEIQDYLLDTVEKYGLRPKLRTGTEVSGASWDAAAGRWRLTTGSPELPELTAEILIGGCGPLSDPAIPDIPGLDGFPGTVFHSSRWDHGHDLADRRVAVVGTGASAIQIVPAVQPQVRGLTLFQRSPAWVMPRRNRPFGRLEQALYGRLPVSQKTSRLGIWGSRESTVPGFTRAPWLLRAGERVATAHLHSAIKDPELRAKLTPDYRLGCKRVLLSDDYYPALAAPNTEVVASGLAKVDGPVLTAADGTAREADTIIFGTGFHVTDLPFAERVTGLGGRTLAEEWRAGGGMSALRGTAVAGFPNLFLLIGPNTGLGHSSMIQIIESQLNLVMDAISRIDGLGGTPVHPRAEAQQKWNAALHKRNAHTVWASGGCGSWYLDENGRNTTLWPGSTVAFRRATRRVRAAEFRAAPRTAGPRLPEVRSADGTRLHVEVHGPEGAPTVVLAHGWTCSTLFWRPVLRELGADFRVVAYDLRGHGRSERPADRGSGPGRGYSTRALVDDLEAVLAATVPDGEQAVLAGHSMGSMTVIAAADRPGAMARASSAVLASTGAYRLTADSAVVPAFFGPARPAATGLVLGLKSSYGPVTASSRRIVKYVTLGPRASRAQADFCARIIHACPPDVRAAFAHVLGGLDLQEQVARLDLPATVIVGDRDRLTPPVHAQRLIRELPRCERVLTLEGAGHMTPVERPRAVADAIRARF